MMSDRVRTLRQQLQEFVPQPQWLDLGDGAPLPPPPTPVPEFVHPPIPTGGYPIDYGWEEEAIHLQALSGEDPQA